MPNAKKIFYDDEWILANWKSYPTWDVMRDAYNKEHGTLIEFYAFRNHCNRYLKLNRDKEYGLNKHYSDEQIDWLKVNYPKLGRVKCTEEFNKLFNENRTVQAIKIQCVKKLKLKVTEERRKARAFNTGKVHPVGSTVCKTHGEPYIKCADGTWKRVKDIIYGDKPKGYMVIHLDGDTNNNCKDNLVAIPRSIAGRMSYNKFWSEFPEVTKTGIICCELEEAIDRSKT